MSDWWVLGPPLAGQARPPWAPWPHPRATPELLGPSFLCGSGGQACCFLSQWLWPPLLISSWKVSALQQQPWECEAKMKGRPCPSDSVWVYVVHLSGRCWGHSVPCLPG